MEIRYSKSAIKFLKKQDKPTQQRIVTAIGKLPFEGIRPFEEIWPSLFSVCHSSFTSLRCFPFLFPLYVPKARM